MENLNETESVRHHQDTSFRAQVILDVGAKQPHQYARNGRTLPAEAAFQSQVLVRDLLKLGLFSMNVSSMAGLEDDTGMIPVSFAKIPSSLLGMGVHYAIDVSPAVQQEGLDAPVIQIDELERHVQRLEMHFGKIDVDMGLVARVAQCARENQMSPGLAAEGS